MFRTIARLLCALPLAAALAGSPAAAAVMLMTFEGRITDVSTDVDFLGFAPAGKAITTTITYDTDVGAYENDGALGVSSASPLGHAISVNGLTLAYTGVHNFSLWYEKPEGGDITTSFSGTLPGAGYGAFLINFRPVDPAAPLSLTAPFESTGIGRGYIDVGTHSVGFEVTKVTVSAVPEPETWALLIAGFGLAGAAIRARRAPAAV